ncbi:transposase [Telmatospirillum sp.]|uniref:IS110 family transposase n=1 Tax=Telmatospirillum sp. TaxID=2079197 RepID=UPI002851A642|nr:transposase [Telmatospirillum sp.]MDR3436591.1 transposase [Telmatospirillum sp.]
MKHYAGLDLSMETTQVCIVDENGRKLVSEKAESSPEAISTLLERYGPIERAVIETGRMSQAICLGLRELGVPVVCIDARQAHQSLKAMKANKTDPHDAAGLAQLARTGFYKEVHVKSPAAHGVRSVITARSHLVEARVRLDNMIRGLCATFGYRPGVGQGKAFLERIMQAAHIPGLGEAITSLLSVRAELGPVSHRHWHRGGGDPPSASSQGGWSIRYAARTASPVWITEWGFSYAGKSCSGPEETAHTQLVQEMMDDFRQLAQEGRLAGLIYYFWTGDTQFDVVRCGGPTASGRAALGQLQ